MAETVMSLNRRPDDQSRTNSTFRSVEHGCLNESDQLKADLKAETGYSSYIEYLRANEGSQWPACDLLEDLDCSETSKSTCFILDLSRGPNSHANVMLRCRTSSPTEVLTSLRHPPSESSVQILLWSVSGIDSDLVSALGLGLKIDSSFFAAVHGRLETPELQSRPSRRYIEFQQSKHIDPLAPSYTKIGRNIVTMAVSYTPGQPHSIPVVLIAGTNWRSYGIVKEPGGSLDGAADKSSYQPCDPPEWWRREEDIGGYARTLQWCLGNGNIGTGNSTNLMFFALLPLVHMHAFRIHGQCDRIRDSYLKIVKPLPLEDWEDQKKRNIAISDLYRHRVLVRRLVEDAEDESEDLIRYMNWQGLTNWLPAHTEFVERYQRVYKSAHRLEAEMRDCLQLQVGEMGLQESRRSIEVSSLQIEESKRAKLFTVLAFVYVPLNLATSIFGMNIYQLNSSGQNLSVFLATASIALFVTGGTWYMIEQINSYRKWRETCLQKDDHKDDHKPTKVALMTRINMLIWLSLSSLRYWTIKRGFWWRLLTNNGSHFCHISEPYRSDQEQMTAAEFVSELSLPKNARRYRYYPEEYRDWVWKTDSSEESSSEE